MEVEGPSLPSNYVTILQLKERWLQQHHQLLPNSKHDDDDDEDHSQLNPKPNDQAALKRVPRRPSHHRTIKESKPKITVDDFDSKTEVDVQGNHPKAEKEEHKTADSNSKLAKKKKGPTPRKPRFVTDQNPNPGGTPLLEAEPVEGKKPLEAEPVERKKPFQHIGGRRRWNQKVVWEPKDKTAPLAQNIGDLSHNDARADDIVEDVAVAVEDSNVPNVNGGTNKRGVSGRFHGKPEPKPWSRSNRVSKPPFCVKKGQASLIWVKKGESAAN